MFWAPEIGFLMVLETVFSFLAMTHFSSAQVPRDKKYAIATNDKIVIKTIKKPKSGAQNIVSTPFHTASTPFLTAS